MRHSGLAAFMIMVGAISVALAIMAYSAVVITILWGWFMVPFGLPRITVAWAFGLSALHFIFSSSEVSTYDGKGPWVHLTRMFAKPNMALIVGFIAHEFM